jgi:rfaE bifunctional protein kinase chain/domain
MKPTREIIANFRKIRLGVLGDLMLDRFIYGESHRMSPEAPVPILLVKDEMTALGGAANVAANIVSLGGTVDIIGVTGNDDASLGIRSLMQKIGIASDLIVEEASRRTTEKIRHSIAGRQILRVDKEDQHYIQRHSEELILEYALKKIGTWDGLVISDYAKGCVTPRIAREIIKLANKNDKFVAADIKSSGAEYFSGVSVLTPNTKEAFEISGHADVLQAGQKIRSMLGCDIIITQGADGMTVFSSAGPVKFSATANHVCDVAGAGDTVTAVTALALAAGLDVIDAAIVANVAAGIAVEKPGVATVSPKELVEALASVEITSA